MIQRAPNETVHDRKRPAQVPEIVERPGRFGLWLEIGQKERVGCRFGIEEPGAESGQDLEPVFRIVSRTFHLFHGDEPSLGQCPATGKRPGHIFRGHVETGGDGGQDMLAVTHASEIVETGLERSAHFECNGEQDKVLFKVGEREFTTERDQIGKLRVKILWQRLVRAPDVGRNPVAGHLHEFPGIQSQKTADLVTIR